MELFYTDTLGDITFRISLQKVGCTTFNALEQKLTLKCVHEAAGTWLSAVNTATE